jgi:N4-gp56 family major capsid protein
MSDFKRYNDPINNVDSTVGEQIVEEAYWRKAIVDAQRDMYFMPLAEVKDMPRNSGKTMKANVYYPLLDDRNISDEGIDAAGAIQVGIDPSGQYTVLHVYLDNVNISEGNTNFPDQGVYPIGGGATTGGYYVGSLPGTDDYNDAATNPLSLAAALVALEAAVDGGLSNYATEVTAVGAVVDTGLSNLYGGSRDPGVITNKLPILAEGAQRVNRVGTNRVVVEGSIEQFGFFTEYTEDTLMFDTDAELMMHITTEMMHAAVEVTEDLLQKDLLFYAESAGTVKLGGTATSKGALTEAVADRLEYDDFVNLSIELDLNRTPKHTTIITGSRMFDTRTVNSARFMYVPPEAVPFLESLEDYHGNKAMIEVRHYEGQTTTMNGEVGTIGSFRIIANPEMMYYPDAGTGGVGAGISKTDGGLQPNVYPFLVVGEDSFSTIGFMSDGKKRNTKFTIHNLRPGADSVTRENPYGNMGLMSIRWWYGFLLKRPERLAVAFTTLPISI